MLDCSQELALAIDKSAAAWEQNVSNLRKQKERSERKRKSNMEHNKAQVDLDKMQKRAKSALQGLQVDDEPLFAIEWLTLPATKVKPVTRITITDSAWKESDTLGVEEPWVMTNCPEIAEWQNRPKILLALSNFGAQYKTTPRFKKDRSKSAIVISIHCAARSEQPNMSEHMLELKPKQLNF